MLPIIFSVYVTKCPFAFLFIFSNSRRFFPKLKTEVVLKPQIALFVQRVKHIGLWLLAFGLYCGITETNCIRSGLNFEWKLRSIAKKTETELHEWMNDNSNKKQMMNDIMAPHKVVPLSWNLCKPKTTYNAFAWRYDVSESDSMQKSMSLF